MNRLSCQRHLHFFEEPSDSGGARPVEGEGRAREDWPGRILERLWGLSLVAALAHGLTQAPYQLIVCIHSESMDFRCNVVLDLDHPSSRI